MFPSPNYNQNPFGFLLKKPSFDCDQSPNTNQDDPSFFLNFPSPFFDEHELPLNQIVSQNQLMSRNDQINTNFSKKETRVKRVSIKGNGAVPVRKQNLGPIPRKRNGKKDRHSKICTAQGIRDRRMRLSLQVARKFFDLQDMLGYDKASKTIEWLFTKSKKAIKELIKDLPQEDNIISFDTPERKIESLRSEIDENSNIEVKEGIQVITLMQSCEKDEKNSEKKTFNLSNLKESRDKARARARYRTREKMMIKWCISNNPNVIDDLFKLGSSSNIPVEGVDQEPSYINQEGFFLYGTNNPLFQKQKTDIDTIEKFLEGSSSSSKPYPISQYNHDFSSARNIKGTLMEFTENWDLLNNYTMISSNKYAITDQVSLTGSSSNSPFEGVDQEFACPSTKQESVLPYYTLNNHKCVADADTIEKLLEGMNSRSSSTSMCPISAANSNANTSNFRDLFANWDMLNNDKVNSNDYDIVPNDVPLPGN